MLLPGLYLAWASIAPKSLLLITLYLSSLENVVPCNSSESILSRFTAFFFLLVFFHAAPRTSASISNTNSRQNITLRHRRSIQKRILLTHIEATEKDMRKGKEKNIALGGNTRRKKNTKRKTHTMKLQWSPTLCTAPTVVATKHRAPSWFYCVKDTPALAIIALANKSWCILWNNRNLIPKMLLARAQTEWFCCWNESFLAFGRLSDSIMSDIFIYIEV